VGKAGVPRGSSGRVLGAFRRGLLHPTHFQDFAFAPAYVPAGAAAPGSAPSLKGAGKLSPASDATGTPPSNLRGLPSRGMRLAARPSESRPHSAPTRSFDGPHGPRPHAPHGPTGTAPSRAPP